jgi:predicted esterase
VFSLALTWVVASAALAADLPGGQISDPVTCAADPSQSYALYLPTAYTPSRAWPLILAFDPGARGRVPVERFQAAAERFGMIVVGSNNSRNFATEFPRMLAALNADVSSRFNIDVSRVYLAGMSGGARTALGVALASKGIAGVIASSAGYPDNVMRASLSFPVYLTAGTEDFNHLEVRQLARALKTPHRLAIFNGGHVWLSSDLAMDAMAWMKLQAMKTGLEARDQPEIDRLFASRQAAAANGPASKQTFLALQAIVEDFKGLADVSAAETRLADLGRDQKIREAIRQEAEEDRREAVLLRDISAMAVRLKSDERQRALVDLRLRWRKLAEEADGPVDSVDRQLARRVLAALSADGTEDPEYGKIIAEYRRGRSVK